jgi:hypothetical protein
MRGLVRVALAGVWVLAASGCGAAALAQTATQPALAAAAPSASPGGACAAVQTTTPIEDVTRACQELWLPYGATEVPPADELAREHVPVAPTVVDLTDGAVPQATAQRWADASNRDSGWWKWAQANDQLLLLRFLVGPALMPADEIEVLQNGGTVSQPDCNLYPLSWTLYPMGAAGRTYFALKRLPTDDAYVFVVVYSGPCAETFHDADGTSTAIVDFTENTTMFSPGVLRSDPLLGDLWFGDAGGNCQDAAGPPAAWCGR